MTATLQTRTMHSPVGTITIAGRDGRIRHLRMDDQTYEPSHDGWEPDETARAGTGEVFLWRIPANASGQWKLSAPGAPSAAS